VYRGENTAALDIKHNIGYYYGYIIRTMVNIRQTVYGLGVLFMFGLIAVGVQSIVQEARYVPAEQQVAAVAESVDGSSLALPEAQPVRLRIPTIGVDTSFVELGVDENREIEVPKSFDTVGWYKYGPTPGELGPAVVLGHVDTKTGPAVFYSLGQLNPGDKVEIDREDGSTAVFEVRTLERYEQDSFPTSLVYGDIDHAGLRLITCSGVFNRDSQRYDQNLVVYAELVEE